MRYIPNTDTYLGIQRWYLPPSVACSFQIGKIRVCTFMVRSFRDGLPVHCLTFVDVKRRVLDRRSSDLIKRIANRLCHRQITNYMCL